MRAEWRPSEAWLYDRNGVLIDSARVDFAARRLAWTPIGQVSEAARGAIVAAEDRRFFRHGGIDWLALASSSEFQSEINMILFEAALSYLGLGVASSTITWGSIPSAASAGGQPQAS